MKTTILLTSILLLTLLPACGDDESGVASAPQTSITTNFVVVSITNTVFTTNTTTIIKTNQILVTNTLLSYSTNIMTNLILVTNSMTAYTTNVFTNMHLITNVIIFTNQVYTTNTIVITNLVILSNAWNGMTTVALTNPQSVELSGGAIISESPLGPALVVNGSNWASLPSSAAINFGGTNLTLSVWARWDTDPKAWAKTTGNKWANIISKNGDYQWQIQHDPDNARFEFALNTSKGRIFLYSVTQPEAGLWYHLAATYDGNAARLWVNGTMEVARTWSGTLATSTAPLDIGRRSVSNDRYFSGSISRITIAARTWGEQEITSEFSTLP